MRQRSSSWFRRAGTTTPLSSSADNA
jgi:hypothetical protein